MKKLFVESVGMVFMIFCIPLYAWGDNAVFNSGFDMSPWDSGWTIETDTSYGRYTSAEAEVKADSGKSLPNSCYLETYVHFEAGSPGGNSGEADAKAMVTQNFDDITDCMIKAHIKYYLLSYRPDCWSQCSLQVCVNDNWKTVWQKFISADWPVFDTVWAEVCTTFVNDTISGVRFCVSSSVYTTCGFGSTSYGHFHVDDVYVGKMRVEEDYKFKITDSRLQIYPNPFTRYASIKLPGNQEKVQIYDMMGRLVEETESRVIGKDLRAGVYFVKVGDYKPVKIIKLMEVL